MLVIAVQISASLPACAAGTGIDASGAKKDYKGLVVNISESSSIHFTPIVAHQKGFLDEEFKDDGITFKYATYVNGPAAVEGYAAGVVDWGQWGDQPIIAAISNGIDVKIVSPSGNAAGQQQLIANKDSGIKKAADIKGKKVAASAGTTMELHLRIILEKLGYTDEDVELVFLPSADIVTALLGGHVDAAVLMDPISTNAINGGGVLIDYVSAYTPAVGVVVGRGEFLRNYPDVAARILQVYDRTIKWIAENPEETAKIAAEYMGLDYEQTLGTLKHIELSVRFKEGYLDALNRTAKFLYDSGTIEKDLTTDDFVDFTYLEKAGLK
jgi:sulfonate transport system substrate-binding protein